MEDFSVKTEIVNDEAFLEHGDLKLVSNMPEQEVQSTLCELSNDSLHSDFSSDIGNYIGQNMNELSDYTKHLLLERHWMPSSNYVFPHNIVKKLGKPCKKFAQRSHLEKFHWLVLSHKDQGLYCVYCTLFAITGKDFARSHLGRLVKEPLKVFDRLMGKKGILIQHESKQYHRMSIEIGIAFLMSYKNPEFDVANKIVTSRMAQTAENRERLRPIIKTIIFCGHQNIALRGHRDNGPLLTINNDESVVAASEGNFRALLKFRIDAGDTALQKHLETASSNATYISKTVQNELIDICKAEIRETIFQNIKNAKFFSLMFEETTDIFHIEQLSLSFRYYKDGNIREDFVCFCDAYNMVGCEEKDSGKELRLTGVALAKIVESLCHQFDVDLSFCVGICTDNCSVMASEAKGAVQELIKKAKHARRCPCNNHILNNSLSASSKVASCRNATATMKKIVAFTNASAKRHQVFLEEFNGVKLQSICETSWVERHDGHLKFQGDNLVNTCNALERISTWNDSKTVSDAYSLLQTLRSSDFIISSICLNDIKESQEVARQLDVQLKSPRTNVRQMHRANHPAETVEAYFRRSIYIPLLDFIVNDLNYRLSPDVLDLIQLGVFLPKSTYSDQDIDTVKKVVQIYKFFFNDTETSIINEYRLWMIKWKREIENKSPIPDSVVDLIDHCDKNLYPNINIFLIILATLPVSAATPERSFSTLRRLKTWLRASMEQERLTGLALLNIHKDLTLDIDEIINKFSKKNRRINFVI
ncbi:52 kDa repressor of the inhibitor of the protein kinase-like [Leptopilina heterotoma]|uniref:52 kDa repressor of the inhibitor of the protein kinase-like n=1 Tax=Leptopilina heterotoma TaxID=63436 RepID=UPI001CA89F6F|nr:52 kDa repressor of the inhibitor of the protein kinase-like [Leptopilina heterotoma]